MSVLGYDTIGGTAEGAEGSSGVPLYFKYVAPANLTLTRIVMYVQGSLAVGITYGIYANSAGSIGAKLGDTAEATLGTSPGWLPSDLDSPVAVTSGTTYWLSKTHAGGSTTYYYDSGSYNSQYSLDLYSAGATPTTPTTPGTLHTDRRISIYADEGGGAPPLAAGTIAVSAGSAANGRISLTETAAYTGGTGSVGRQWQRSTVGSGSGFSNVSSATGTSLNDSGLTNGVTYYYRLAYTDDITTEYSNEDSATPVAKSAVVCIGDSITYGYGLTGAGTATGQTYPAGLQTALGSDWVVTNAGQSSDTLDHMLTRVTTDITAFLADALDKVVIILGGINDAVVEEDDAATVKAEIDALVAAIHSENPTALIFVGLVPSYDDTDFAAILAAVNDSIISDPSPDSDSIVWWHDGRYGTYAAVHADSGHTLFQDGVHPTALVAAWLTSAAYAAIRQSIDGTAPTPGGGGLLIGGGMGGGFQQSAS